MRPGRFCGYMYPLPVCGTDERYSTRKKKRQRCAVYAFCTAVIDGKDPAGQRCAGTVARQAFWPSVHGEWF